MIVKLLTEHHLEFLRLKGDCRGSSESTLAKMSNCWKSHAAAHMLKYYLKEDLVLYMDLWTVEYWSLVVEEQMQLQHMEQVNKQYTR